MFIYFFPYMMSLLFIVIYFYLYRHVKPYPYHFCVFIWLFFHCLYLFTYSYMYYVAFIYLLFFLNCLCVTAFHLNANCYCFDKLAFRSYFSHLGTSFFIFLVMLCLCTSHKILFKSSILESWQMHGYKRIVLLPWDHMPSRIKT